MPHTYTANHTQVETDKQMDRDMQSSSKAADVGVLGLDTPLLQQTLLT